MGMYLYRFSLTASHMQVSPRLSCWHLGVAAPWIRLTQEYMADGNWAPRNTTWVHMIHRMKSWQTGRNEHLGKRIQSTFHVVVVIATKTLDKRLENFRPVLAIALLNHRTNNNGNGGTNLFISCTQAWLQFSLNVLLIAKRHCLIAGLQIILQHQSCSLPHFWGLPLQQTTRKCDAMVQNLAKEELVEGNQRKQKHTQIADDRNISPSFWHPTSPTMITTSNSLWQSTTARDLDSNAETWSHRNKEQPIQDWKVQYPPFHAEEHAHD